MATEYHIPHALFILEFGTHSWNSPRLAGSLLQVITRQRASQTAHTCCSRRIRSHASLPQSAKPGAGSKVQSSAIKQVTLLPRQSLCPWTAWGDDGDGR